MSCTEEFFSFLAKFPEYAITDVSFVFYELSEKIWNTECTVTESGGSWRLYDAATSDTYATGPCTREDDTRFKVETPSVYLYPYGTGLEQIGNTIVFKTGRPQMLFMVFEATFDETICWKVTFKRVKSDRISSIEGPGRFPSKIRLPHDALIDSALLIEDGVEIPNTSYLIELALEDEEDV